MDQDIHLNLDQPVAPAQEVAEAPVTPEPPIEEVANEAPADSVEKKTETDTEQAPTEDRSAFNCVPCEGLGLKDEVTICPSCQGTGKV